MITINNFQSIKNKNMNRNKIKTLKMKNKMIIN